MFPRIGRLRRTIAESREVGNRALEHAPRLSPQQQQIARTALDARFSELKTRLTAARRRTGARLATNPRLMFRLGRIKARQKVYAAQKRMAHLRSEARGFFRRRLRIMPQRV